MVLWANMAPACKSSQFACLYGSGRRRLVHLRAHTAIELTANEHTAAEPLSAHVCIEVGAGGSYSGQTWRLCVSTAVECVCASVCEHSRGVCVCVCVRAAKLRGANKNEPAKAILYLYTRPIRSRCWDYFICHKVCL